MKIYCLFHGIVNAIRKHGDWICEECIDRKDYNEELEISLKIR
jgi:hypothetical protein